MIEEAVRRKIEALVRRAMQLTPLGGTLRDNQHAALCRSWITESLNIIELAVPIENNSYRRQIKKLGEGSGLLLLDRVASIGAVLEALLIDIDSGLIADFGNKIRAETFDDFLDHAETYLDEGQTQVAGVLAGVVFEDTIRRICRDKGITEKGDSLENLINTLARQNVITGQQSKQAKVGSHIRAKATHAQWDEFDVRGVKDTVQITRALLEKHLGG